MSASEASALFDVVGEGAPVGLAFLDVDLRFVRVNAALAGINGLPVSAHLGRTLEEVLPGLAPTLVPIYRRVLRTGDPVLEREVTAEVGEAGHVRHVLASWFPVRVKGEIAGVGVVVVDITARKEAELRQDVLVRAGEVLDSALGVDERLDRLARQLVPEMADYVKIELLEGRGGRRPVAIAHQDPEREALMRAWRERGTLGERERVGMGTTIATGEAKLTPEIAEEAVVESARVRTGEEGAELMRAIGPRSQIVVPLRARGRVLGALSLTMAESGRRYTEADLDLVRDIGLRAGLAVDNARLYEEAQAAAAAEQRRAEQLDALAAASLAIHRTRRLEPRLDRIAERARELLDCRRAVVTIMHGRADERTAVAELPGPAPAGGRLLAPLVARDGTDLGSIEVADRRTGEFGATDSALLEELARIASLAIENARLEERERHIARTLQDSLLPRRLPEIDGLEAEARYLPGGEGTVVGGDLYDLFPVDGEWAFVVGDVCGKGAEAAALTAMVRYTIRAEAAHGDSPCEVLSLLNAAILRQDVDGRFCTVVHGRVRVHPGGARLVIANAGHPPPLVLRADGTVETVCCSGRLLGVVPEVTAPDVAVELASGDAMVCFTDGITEGRGAEGMFGDARLIELVAGAHGADAAALADRIVDAALAFQGGRTQDDLAVLVLRVPEA